MGEILDQFIDVCQCGIGQDIGIDFLRDLKIQNKLAGATVFNCRLEGEQLNFGIKTQLDGQLHFAEKLTGIQKRVNQIVDRAVNFCDSFVIHKVPPTRLFVAYGLIFVCFVEATLSRDVPGQYSPGLVLLLDFNIFLRDVTLVHIFLRCTRREQHLG